MDTLIWPLEPVGPRAARLPDRLVTRAPFAAQGALDLMTALLLPAGDGVGAVPHSEGDRSCIGLWLGTPFLPSAPVGAGWICNFPPASAFDASFVAEMSEVELGPERERAHLAALRAADMRVMLAGSVGMADPTGADALLIAVRGAGDLEALRGGYIGEMRARLGRDLPCAVFGEEGRLLPRRPEQDGFDAVLRLP